MSQMQSEKQSLMEEFHRDLSLWVLLFALEARILNYRIRLVAAYDDLIVWHSKNPNKRPDQDKQYSELASIMLDAKYKIEDNYIKAVGMIGEVANKKGEISEW